MISYMGYIHTDSAIERKKIMKKRVWKRWITCLLLCSLILNLIGCSDKEVSDQINDVVEEGGKQLTNVDDKIRNITDANNKYVQKVKKAYVMGQPMLTYGAAFEEFFRSPTWKHFTSKNNKEVVEFTGRCKYDNESIKVRMQFLFNDDGEKFVPSAMKCNDMLSNDLTLVALLYNIFGSYIKNHNLTASDDQNSYFDSLKDSNSELEEPDGQIQDSGSLDSSDAGTSSTYNDSSDTDTSSIYNDTSDADTSSIYDNTSDDSDTDVLDDYDDGEYIFPTSDTRKLAKSDIKGKSKKELRIGRNEIYARHGRRFQDEELQDYFDSQSWYEGTTDPQDFSEDELSSVEKRNARYIQKFE